LTSADADRPTTTFESIELAATTQWTRSRISYALLLTSFGTIQQRAAVSRKIPRVVWRTIGIPPALA
jgi:hypothetical protein